MFGSARPPVAAALAVVVLLSGCSALPGGGGGGAGAPDAPERHDVVFQSHTGGVSFEATVTVSADGETLATESVSADGNGTYANLTSLRAPGPYTVTVNTTIPAAGGGNMSRSYRVTDPLGNATALQVTYAGITRAAHPLPVRDVERSAYLKKPSGVGEVAVVVRHEGRVVYEGTTTESGDATVELSSLPETGVYRVTARTKEHTTVETVVLRESESWLLVGFRGTIPAVESYGPGMPTPTA